MSRIERAGEQASERQVVQLPRLAQNEVEDEEFDEVRASRRRYVSDCLSNVRTARCFFVVFAVFRPSSASVVSKSSTPFEMPSSHRPIGSNLKTKLHNYRQKPETPSDIMGQGS